MSEPTKQPNEQTEPKDKPKYETPRVVSLGNMPEGEGGNVTCSPGSANLTAGGCKTGAAGAPS